jgi:NAD(P)H-nitrite reductase large subunit
MRYVIVGNGMAGVSAAIGLRDNSPDAEIILYTDEPYTFYSRPGLMYHMMGMEKEWDLYCDRPGVYTRSRLDLRRGRVLRLSPDRDELLVEGQPAQPFDRLLLAVGAQPRKLNITGEHLPGVHNFTLMSDAKAMMEVAKPGMRGVVIGGGLLGAEISEVWRHFGMHVTILVIEDWYFPRALSEEQGRVVQNTFRRHGVDVRTNEEAAEFIEKDGKLAGVRTRSGLELPCELACVTIGVEPRRLLAQESGLEVARGIVVDRTLQTSRLNVFACGDCAEIQDPATGKSTVELLWYSARAQGGHAAHCMAGALRPYDPGTFYNSAMFFDLDYVSVGSGRYPGDGQEESVFSSRNGRQVRRITHRNGRVTGITSVGTSDRYEDLIGCVEGAYTVDELTRVLGRRKWFGG